MSDHIPERALSILRQHGPAYALALAQELMLQRRLFYSPEALSERAHRAAALRLSEPSIAVVRDGRLYARLWALLDAWPPEVGEAPSRGDLRALAHLPRRSIRVPGHPPAVFRDLGPAPAVAREKARARVDG